MTTGTAIVIAASIWSVTQMACSLFGWFLVFPWQREYERRSQKWLAFPMVDEKKEAKQ